MSRRASLLAKQEKRKPRVRFPDELVFLDNIKGNDIQACHSMLRRASVQLDINGLDANGLTPLHNAVLEGNLAAVKLLVQHGADVNKKDVDTWTPLHAACANGEADIARYLLSKGASKDIKTNDGERPLDLCDARDFSVISVMLESDSARKAKLKDLKDDEFKDDDLNNNSEDEADGRHSAGSSDASPEPQRRSTGRNDAKNANIKSSTFGLVKAMGSLKTVMEDNVSFDLPSPDVKSSTNDPFSRSTNKSPVPQKNSPTSKLPPATGHSILKKSK
ncbi:protein phosphatase 1 regulatory subunit 12A [Biomphalaria pfeifferi]|uniref:Protein phosphatase 1 regulatory subunit 12A n=1 Tax=Biomphalaria pfeifferi TaxID=112525 RepID=A0AAD8B3W0_BIOPF|nr:protein phosphatase 1 regulatory subunit 12A [Biomphalaria pfeifferi]